MSEVHANVTLRPTRIGFLVRPTDLSSVRKIMRVCSCLWGGMYNPIIPVFRTAPKEWRRERFERPKGIAIGKGYIDFFEPDVFVESESGLAEKVGLSALLDRRVNDPCVLSLKDFLAPKEPKEWAEPAFGLSIFNVFRHLYETEQRFEPRDSRMAAYVLPQRGNGVVEAIFGAYPQQENATYFVDGYTDAFAPKEFEASPESWRQLLEANTQTPLRITRFGIETRRYWYHDVVVYVFDPKRPTDLIDLWNLRIEPCPVLPVPINWFEDLLDDIRRVIADEYRPVKGNPSGIMHRATVEFGRSIANDQVEELVEPLKKGLPKGALVVKHWRNRIWVRRTDDRVHRDSRLETSATEKSVRLSVRGQGRLTATFDTLAPEFASRFGAPNCRWVNSVKVSEYGDKRLATVIPFNNFDRRWPRLGGFSDQMIVGTEGWIFPQSYKNWTERITFLSREEAIVGSLKELGIEAKASDPGRIAKQMLDHLGGIWGVGLVADHDTIQLLNNMAGGVRRKESEGQIVEEIFNSRSAPVSRWRTLIAERNGKRGWPKFELDDFTKRNIVQLGLESVCPHCQFKNWHGLKAVDYQVSCERCLNRYDFPQANWDERNPSWRYRVVGPFSVPDYGRGSYGALLALRVLQDGVGASDSAITFSTALELEFDEFLSEVDFVAWHTTKQHDKNWEPSLVIGETKSLGRGELIKSKDLASLKSIGRKLPGAFILIAVMRDHFTENEKKLLRSFVLWGRRLDADGLPTNPVILLTANELFAEHYVTHAWEEIGKPFSEFTDYEFTRNLENFAESTQRIYLGLPSYFEQREAQWRKLKNRKCRPKK